MPSHAFGTAPFVVSAAATAACVAPVPASAVRQHELMRVVASSFSAPAVPTYHS
jgi:hypothetical protein